MPLPDPVERETAAPARWLSIVGIGEDGVESLSGTARRLIGAAEIVFRREIDSAEDQAAKRKELVDEYRDTFANPYVAGGRRLVDDIVEPAETRRYLAQALESLHTKRELRPQKKHGLIPL